MSDQYNTEVRSWGPVLHILYILLILCAGLPACGAAAVPASDAGPDPAITATSSATGFATNLRLEYGLTIQLDSEDDQYDIVATYGSGYVLDLLLTGDGALKLRANDVPPMVYRVCAPDSNRSDCDGYSDATGGIDVDLVIDACGRFVDDAGCGDADETVFTGSIDAAGNILLEEISIRMRLFAITAKQDGFKANASDQGLMRLKRLVVDLTTGSVASGELTAEGIALQDRSVTLVSAGVVSTTVPHIGGADFITVLEGEFDPTPFSLYAP